jgi:hypothetical protein
VWLDILTHDLIKLRRAHELAACARMQFALSVLLGGDNKLPNVHNNDMEIK